MGIWRGWVNVADYGRLAHLIERLDIRKLNGFHSRTFDASLVAISIWPTGQPQPIEIECRPIGEEQPLKVWVFSGVMYQFLDEIDWYKPKLE
jgi:hypothetical protein